jgi:hypothetical protein
MFSDADGDGRFETFFLNLPVDPAARRSLCCFDGDGKLRWEFVPGRTVVDRYGHSYAPPFWPNSLALLSSERSRSWVVVSSHHHWSFPNQVSILDALTGRQVTEYWHRGHLLHMTLADLDADGRPELLLGACG